MREINLKPLEIGKNSNDRLVTFSKESDVPAE